MNFLNLAKDIITIIKPDGTVFKDIKANVQPNKIFIHDEKLPLEEGDKIYRKLPSGLVEIYVVLNRGFYSTFGSIPGHFQAKVVKEGSINEAKFKSITNVYNATGVNARININSRDNSTNFYNDTNLLFSEIKKVIESIEEKDVQVKSLQLLEELKRTQKTSAFLINYLDFISILANHMTVIAPFIPALTQLIIQ